MVRKEHVYTVIEHYKKEANIYFTNETKQGSVHQTHLC